MLVVELCVSLEQRQHILHAEFAHGLATLQSSSGELALRFLQLQDALFDGVVDGETVNCDVDGLIQTMDTVDGLFFDELCGR